MMALAQLLRPLAIPESPLRWWITRGGTAVFDQGVLAGSNFALTLTLASTLPPADFGAFTFAFVLFTILSGFHNALILEPATVLRTSLYEEHHRAYCRAQLVLHAAVTLPMTAALAVPGMLAVRAGHVPLGRAMIAAAAAAPFVLLLLLARRFLYILGRPGAAASGSFVYFAVMASALAAAWSTAPLSPATGFAVLGGASAVAAVFLLHRGGVLRRTGRGFRLDLGELARERWIYGRWLLGAVCVESAVIPGLTAITATMLGLAGVGVLRALQIFTVPIGHSVTALAALTLPVLARDFGQARLEPLRRKAQTALTVALAAAVAAELGLIAFHQPLEHLVYGGKFADYSYLIPLVGAAALLESLAGLHAMLLSAVQRPRLYFVSLLITAPCALAAGYLCTRAWGLSGAAAALVITAAVSVISRRQLARPWLAARTATAAP